MLIDKDGKYSSTSLDESTSAVGVFSAIEILAEFPCTVYSNKTVTFTASIGVDCCSFVVRNELTIFTLCVSVILMTCKFAITAKIFSILNQFNASTENCSLLVFEINFG